MKIIHILIAISMVFYLASCSSGIKTAASLTISIATNSPTILPSSTRTPTTTLSPSTTRTPTITFTQTATPILPFLSEVITENNSSKLALLATWGKGTIIDARWLFDDKLLLIHTKSGVYVYDSENWSLKEEWPGGKALSISHNREIIAVGFGGGKATIWNAKSNRKMEIDQGSRGEVNTGSPVNYEIPDALALSPEGAILAVAGRDSHLGLWDTNTGSIIGDFSGSLNYVSIAFSPNANLLVAQDGMGRKITILDALNRKSGITIEEAGYFSNSPFSPDGSKLVTVQDYDITIWDTKTAAVLSRRLVGKGLINATFSDDGNYIIINDYEKVIRVSDGNQVSPDSVSHSKIKPLPDLSTLETTDFFPGNVTGVGLGPKDDVFAWGPNNHPGGNPLLWWHINSHTILPPDWMRCDNIHSSYDFGMVSVSPDCTLEAEATVNLFFLYKTVDHSLLHNLFAHTQKITKVTFSSDGKYFASGAGTTIGEVILWRTDPTAGIWKFNPEHEVCVCSLAFSPDGTLIAVGGFNKIHIYDILQRREILVISGWSEALAFSPDNKLLAVGLNYGWNNSIEIISLNKNLTYTSLSGAWSLAPLMDIITNPYTDILPIETTSLSFTQNGDGMFVGLSDGTVQLWGIPSSGGT